MKQRMADNEWMYSGRISVTERTAEWQWKTDYYVKDTNRGSKEVRPLCPCARCKMRFRQGTVGMTKHLWLYGYTPDFTMRINFAEGDRARDGSGDTPQRNPRIADSRSDHSAHVVGCGGRRRDEVPPEVVLAEVGRCHSSALIGGAV